jgi:hypothetical protein
MSTHNSSTAPDPVYFPMVCVFSDGGFASRIALSGVAGGQTARAFVTDIRHWPIDQKRLLALIRPSC